MVPILNLLPAAPAANGGQAALPEIDGSATAESAPARSFGEILAGQGGEGSASSATTKTEIDGELLPPSGGNTRQPVGKDLPGVLAGTQELPAPASIEAAVTADAIYFESYPATVEVATAAATAATPAAEGPGVERPTGESTIAPIELGAGLVPVTPPEFGSSPVAGSPDNRALTGSVTTSLTALPLAGAPAAGLPATGTPAAGWPAPATGQADTDFQTVSPQQRSPVSAGTAPALTDAVNTGQSVPAGALASTPVIPGQQPPAGTAGKSPFSPVSAAGMGPDPIAPVKSPGPSDKLLVADGAGWRQPAVSGPGVTNTEQSTPGLSTRGLASSVQSTPEQSTSVQSTSVRSTPVPPTLGQSILGQSSPEQSIPVLSSPAQANLGQANVGQANPEPVVVQRTVLEQAAMDQTAARAGVTLESVEGIDLSESGQVRIPHNPAQGVTPATTLPLTDTAQSSGLLSGAKPEAMTHPPGHANWNDELAGRVSLLIKSGLNEARLQLSPAELGHLEIKISTEGDRAVILFNVQHSATREAIDLAMPRLREMLEQSGLQLAHSEVSDQSQSGRDNHGGAAELAGATVGLSGGEDTDNPGGVAHRLTTARPHALVDYYA